MMRSWIGCVEVRRGEWVVWVTGYGFGVLSGLNDI